MNNVEWGGYKIEDLFNVKTSKSLDEGKLVLLPNKDENLIEFVGRTRVNNGVKGYIKEIDICPNEAEVISVSQIGTITAQLRTSKWYASQNIFILEPKDKRIISLFTVSAINKALSCFLDGYSYYPTLTTLKELVIELPIKNKNINFDFMKNFITQIELRHINELDSYLLNEELKEYSLTDEEQEFIGNIDGSSQNINLLLNNKLKQVEWCEYKMEDLFDRVKTNKLPYKAKELPNNPTGEYVLPCLTSSFMNQGLNYYVPKDNATILKNVISIPSNSDVYRAYYQSRDFTVLSDAYAICWKNKDVKITSNHYLFMVLCINKVTDLSIYSYKNKLGGWNVVKNKHILLPQKNGKIDFDFMEKIIRIAKKLAIKDVVLYSEKKIEEHCIE